MRVIALSKLRMFWEKHLDSMQSLKSWFKDAEGSTWATPVDVKAFSATVSILKDNRAVFNIKGNKYRLVVRINYDHGVIYIRFVGTHKEYDAVDAESI